MEMMMKSNRSSNLDDNGYLPGLTNDQVELLKDSERNAKRVNVIDNFNIMNFFSRCFQRSFGISGFARYEGYFFGGFAVNVRFFYSRGSIDKSKT